MGRKSGRLGSVFGGALLGVVALAGMGFAQTAPDAQQTTAAPQTTPETKAEAAAELPTVTVDPARLAEVQERVPLSGSLVARQEVMIFPRVSGYAVTALLADIGDHVEIGQKLAQLQDQTLAAQLKQADAEYVRTEAGVKQAESQIVSAEASLTEAATALDRSRRLRASGSSSQASLEQAIAAEAAARANAASAHDGLSVARGSLAQAEASRDIARLNLDYTQITTPVAGVVATRNAELGALSGSSADPMFTIIANDEVELAAEVLETSIPRLQPGVPVIARISGVGEVTGKLRLLPASVDATTRLGTVRVALDPDPRLRPGLFASGDIVVAQDEQLTVPTSAVLISETGEVVQVVTGDTIELRPVKAGAIWDGRRAILEGLKPGEVVVARAGAFFRSGDRIRAVPLEPGSGSEVGSDKTGTAP
ncbi:efflux RND transporter periplasmic adaptor subunit [Paracoccus aminophilus]|uniref:RND family efflux transporter MFP subunit n=1 Tax=Paracoccus aminophilus JCM 7686 TaxID=1367847 RepID=S5XLQ8_PARAH|nr:efflux RND transporter periplasmic adaptor subunit [Paracoccus aminophilus]AGT08159.1 RND family efflux transporter MFP subunit [Paracoccus aminophilus JCM 7686]